MPVLARLDGIIIRMYFQQEEHNPPHVHAIYGDYIIAVDIRTGEVLDGSFPPKRKAIVSQWVLEHQSDLLHIWETQDFTRFDPKA